MKKILFALAVIVFANSTASAQCGKVRVFGGNHKLFGGGLFKRNQFNLVSHYKLSVVAKAL